jgi:peptide/nickel transport system substrate-binding protein
MRRGRRRIAVCLVVVLAGCTSAADRKHTGSAAPLPYPRGGFVRVAMLADSLGQSGPGSALDPSREYVAEPWEIFRCCILRTLYQYSGRQTEAGGAVLRPDLATAAPELSADGLTLTIRIRPGIYYAPPLEHQQVVAQDFVTALKRVARVAAQDPGGDYSAYYSIIRGFDAYAHRRADSISGISTPDPHTLVFSLTARAGDFADRFAMAATAPIPSVASSPGEYGVATGHDRGYGRYLIGTGPYMVKGSEHLTPGLPAEQQKPAAGFLPGARTIELVRNPSWNAATDPLRPAYPDRIELQLLPTIEKAYQRIDDGSADVLMSDAAPGAPDFGEYRRYRADPALGRAVLVPRGDVRYVSMNLAQPPFDDVHVRRAANFIVDKPAFIERLGGALAGSPATHVVPDSLEDDQLVNYDPYRSASRAQALARAEAEMRLSKYDPQHDGRCDAKPCRRGVALALAFDPPHIRAARSVARDLERIGIHLRLKLVDGAGFFPVISDPRAKVPLGIDSAWGHDFLNASDFITPLFAGPEVSPDFTVPGSSPGQCCNFALVGASAALLRHWGYPVTHVASVDDRINECLGLFGQPQTDCWTALDQYLTEVVVPWVPLMTETTSNVVPSRVRSIAFDDFAELPSLDRVVMKR